jgi:ribosomal protein S28E/S33
MLSVTVARAAGGGETGPDSKVTLSRVVGGAERSRFILTNVKGPTFVTDEDGSLYMAYSGS